MADEGYTQTKIQELVRLQLDQETRIRELSLKVDTLTRSNEMLKLCVAEDFKMALSRFEMSKKNWMQEAIGEIRGVLTDVLKEKHPEIVNGLGDVNANIDRIRGVLQNHRDNFASADKEFSQVYEGLKSLDSRVTLIALKLHKTGTITRNELLAQKPLFIPKSLKRTLQRYIPR